jgi:hypothetical protein
MSMSSESHPAALSLEQEDRSPQFRAFLIFLTIIDMAAIILRFWSRSLLHVPDKPDHRRFWWDDWVALASLVRSWYSITSITEVSHCLHV